MAVSRSRSCFFTAVVLAASLLAANCSILFALLVLSALLVFSALLVLLFALLILSHGDFLVSKN